jgi:hypothetical protein
MQTLNEVTVAEILQLLLSVITDVSTKSLHAVQYSGVASTHLHQIKKMYVYSIKCTNILHAVCWCFHILWVSSSYAEDLSLLLLQT